MIDTELDKRLDKIEQQISIIASHQPPVFGNVISSRSDEIDLRELFAILWQGKWWIMGITFLFAVAGVLYALSLPNMYKSEGIYAPAQQQGGAALGGQLGGLASLAGVSLGGGESNDIDQAIALMSSRPFLESAIEKFDLKPLILGVKGWNKADNQLVWDNEVYDPASRIWLRKPPKGYLPEPSLFEAYVELRKMIRVSFDEKTSLFNISVQHVSPSIALNWVSMFASELNLVFRSRDIANSNTNIRYLEDKINATSLAGMQAVFYGMVESQMQTLMLAELREDYLISNVVLPVAAEKPNSPKRKFIVLVSVLLGVIVAIFSILFRQFLSGRV